MEDQRPDQLGDNGSMDTNVGDIDSLLDQALSLSTGSPSEIHASNTSKSHAEALLAIAEREVQRSVEDQSDKILSEARDKEKTAQQLREASQHDKKEAKRIQAEARKIEKVAQDHLKQAEQEAEELKRKLLDESRAAAEEEAKRIRVAATGEIQSKVNALQTLKMAIREESETAQIVKRAIALRTGGLATPMTRGPESIPVSASLEETVATAPTEDKTPKTSRKRRAKTT